MFVWMNECSENENKTLKSLISTWNLKEETEKERKGDEKIGNKTTKVTTKTTEKITKKMKEKLIQKTNECTATKFPENKYVFRFQRRPQMKKKTTMDFWIQSNSNKLI